MKRGVCEHREVGGVQIPGCGAELYFVLVIPEPKERPEGQERKPGPPDFYEPTAPRKRPKRKYVPLDPIYDPECGTPPSHAVSIGWTTCRPLPPGETPAPSERLALTHFATCPHRRPRP